MPLNPEQEEAIANLGYIELQNARAARRLRLIRNTAVSMTATFGGAELLAQDGAGKLFGLGVLAIAGTEYVAIQRALRLSAEAQEETYAVMLEAFEQSTEN